METQKPAEKPSQKIMDRIRKCMALGDITKGATEDEAATAISMAKKLMQEYGLNMSDVEVKQEAAAGANSATDTIQRKDHPQWEFAIARVADALFGASHYLTSAPFTGKDGRPKGWVRRVAFVGVGQDAQLASEVHTILVNAIWKMAYDHGYTGNEHKSYCTGVAQMLLKRARETVKDTTPAQAETCRGIMVIKNAVIETHMKTLNLRDGRASRMRSVDSAAFVHGQADGKKMNMGFRKSLNGGN